MRCFRSCASGSVSPSTTPAEHHLAAFRIAPVFCHQSGYLMAIGFGVLDAAGARDNGIGVLGGKSHAGR